MKSIIFLIVISPVLSLISLIFSLNENYPEGEILISPYFPSKLVINLIFSSLNKVEKKFELHHRLYGIKLSAIESIDLEDPF